MTCFRISLLSVLAALSAHQAAAFAPGAPAAQLLRGAASAAVPRARAGGCRRAPGMARLRMCDEPAAEPVKETVKPDVCVVVGPI
ncbi:hypothetical protein T484DRAFT_1845033 [Baffinella frigidus]|nr:hypothetical protein T484DRAFT_1845033 [Cryptophyta sp. CCMP2293]